MAYAQSDFGDPPPEKYLDPSAGAPPKPGRGCWFYGCVTLVVLGIIGLIAMGAAAYTAYYYYNKVIKDYTATAPVELPKAQITEEDRKSIDDRWKSFQEALDRGEAAELVLTAEDLNALISENDAMKGKIFVSIEGSDIGGKVSYPLSETGIPGTSGRFFNGNVTFTVKLEDGYLEAYIKSVEVNGKKPPDDMLQQISHENVLKNNKYDDETRDKIRKIESLTVKDGKIYLKSRAKKKPDDEPTKDKPAADAPKDETKPTEPPTVETKPAEAPKEEPKPAEVPKDEAKPADAPKEETKPVEAPKEETKPTEAPKAI